MDVELDRPGEPHWLSKPKPTPMRYVVFYGDNYYPRGGAQDEHTRFPTLEQAIAFAKGRVVECLTWAHVWDSETEQIEFEARS